MNKRIKILAAGSIFFIATLLLTAQAISKTPTYSNKELGMRINAPPGWDMTEPEGKNTVYLFLFHKYRIGSTLVGANPGIVSSAKTTKEKTALAAAGEVINGIIKVFYIDAKIIEAPKPVVINGNQGVVFLSEMTVMHKKRTFRIKQQDYLFLKREMLIRLTAFCEPEQFENNIKDFQASLDTLQLK